jgi:hypothetical protein
MSRAFAILIVALVVATWALYGLIRGDDAWSSLGPFSIAVGVLTTASFVFSRWIWNWPLIHNLVRTPYLSGTWVGTLKSDYVVEAQEQPVEPKLIAWVISQTSDSLSVRQFTEESESEAVTATAVEEKGDRHSIATVYVNKPVLLRQPESRIHDGAARLSIQGPVRSPTSLTGYYWTTRKTGGELELKFISRKEAHSFEEAVSMTTVEGAS